MELQELLAHVGRGELVEGGSPAHEVMHAASQDALRTLLADCRPCAHRDQEPDSRPRMDLGPGRRMPCPEPASRAQGPFARQVAP